jgi:hypothetical protein
MRMLEFDVSRQKITKTRGCDFKHIVAGSRGYLKAKFNFSDEGGAWNGCVKAASFWLNDEEYAVILDESNSCYIPDEVLDGRNFFVSVTGLTKNDDSNYMIKTNKIKITQGVF